MFGRLEPSSFRKYAIACFDLCDSLLKVLCVNILLFSNLINGLYSLKFLDLVKFNVGVCTRCLTLELGQLSELQLRNVTCVCV
jgi:hypothetical protein